MRWLSRLFTHRQVERAPPVSQRSGGLQLDAPILGPTAYDALSTRDLCEGLVVMGNPGFGQDFDHWDVSTARAVSPEL